MDFNVPQIRFNWVFTLHFTNTATLCFKMVAAVNGGKGCCRRKGLELTSPALRSALGVLRSVAGDPWDTKAGWMRQGTTCSDRCVGEVGRWRPCSSLGLDKIECCSKWSNAWTGNGLQRHGVAVEDTSKIAGPGQARSTLGLYGQVKTLSFVATLNLKGARWLWKCGDSCVLPQQNLLFLHSCTWA